MEKTERVVIDTSAFYALVAEEDRYHQRAHSVFDLLVLEDTLLYTTSYAIVETQALVSRRLGFDALMSMLDTLASGVEIVWVTRELHQTAWSQFVKAGGSGLGLVDWTVALTARQLDAKVFAFDSDFARAGFEVVSSL